MSRKTDHLKLTATELAEFAICELRTVLDEESPGAPSPYVAKRRAEGSEIHADLERQAKATVPGSGLPFRVVVIGGVILGLFVLIRMITG